MTISTDRSNVPLAIIGMACRLPGARNLDEYWRLIVEGRSAVTEVPPERLDAHLYYDPQRGVRGKTYSKKAALLADRHFDAVRCPVPDDLRQRVDNTHLLMTGVAADALRHAGFDPFQLPDRNTAVFMGHAQGSSQLGELIFRTYLQDALEILESIEGFRDLSSDEQAGIRQELTAHLLQRHPVDREVARDLSCNMVSGTIAKAFGLTGPWLALNSACASSLHAMLLGARALQRGRADMVIVGGASDCKSDSLVLFSNAQAMSAEATRPFDADADGLIMSEGYVALVMKSLERALADGDPIQAVVRGLGVATDGRGKSLWAPRKEGQMKAMLRAYRSGIDISRLQYLECHATATQLGDATELTTLGEVLSPQFPTGKRIPITSVKANIGHSLEAAGMAGLIKTVLCMQHKTVPPAINIESLNPKVDWDSAPYYVPLQTEPWPAQPDGGPRSAAVNAFGIGGLNMHVVLDEYSPNGSTLVSAPGMPQSAEERDDQAIAVVGMSCIFPGASGLSEFWNLLLSGNDPKTLPPEDRWSRRGVSLLQRHNVSPVGGFVTDYAYDWRKHKVPPKQVAEADPLQFMLLDASEQAMEDAGYRRDSIDREKCGVVVGTEFGGDFGDHLEMGLRLPEIEHYLSEALRRRGLDPEKVERIKASYADRLLKKWPSLIDETGSFTSSTLASRISKTLDLAGGALAIDSGGTSAMNAISICIDMLQSGDNDLMICAAGQRRMGLFTFQQMAQIGMLSPNGAPANLIDAEYDGIVPGEGVGAIVLKRLSDARRDGDRIHSIIRGIGIGHSESLREAARMATIRSCATAGVHPDDISFLELDTDERLIAGAEPIDVLVASHATPSRQRELNVTSVGSQIGHLGGGAAMASLIKASLEVEKRQLPETFRLSREHPVLSSHRAASVTKSVSLSDRALGAVISWSRGQVWHLIVEQPIPTGQPTPSPAADTAAAPAHDLTTTPKAISAGTVSAGTVSAGTVSASAVSASATPTNPVSGSANPVSGNAVAADNSCAEQPAEPPRGESSPRIVRFGAGSQEQLVREVGMALGDIPRCWQSSESRRFGSTDKFRLGVVADSAAQLERKLKLAQGQLDRPLARQVLEQQGVFVRQLMPTRPRVAFVFPGQGSQYDGMLRKLVGDLPAAAQELERVDLAMKRFGFPSFAELAWAATTQLGKDVWCTQISLLLADAICLASLRHLGIEPDLVLGHSYGEFVALYAAGVWDFETAIRMTKARCEGIEAIASGDAGMLATNAPVDEVKRLLESRRVQAYVANYNAPDQTVVGGKCGQLEQFAAVLTAESFQARMLPVPAAFHTPLMAGASRRLVQRLQQAVLREPQVPTVSTVDNALLDSVDHIRRNLGGQLTTPVQYAPLIARLDAECPTVFVEVGPQQTLTKLNRRIVGPQTSVIACDHAKRPGLEPLLCVQALLECLGVLAGDARQMADTDSNFSASTAEPLEIPMDEQIPHFDATQRRREKMRQASAGAPVPNTNGNGAAPATLVQANAPASLPESSSRQTPPATQQAATTSRATWSAESSPTPSPETPSEPAPKPPTVPTAASTPTHDTDWESFLVGFVVEQTGYPPEVVDLDADLEADLGIDSIKKAQLFGELQEYFDVGSMDASDMSLDDFPTLRHVLSLLTQGADDNHGQIGVGTANPRVEAAATSSPSNSAVSVAAPAPAQGLSDLSAAPDQLMSDQPETDTSGESSEMESFLINFVVEQTGYPPEVVELDADLEADLGIDSIKKAQLFGELQEYFDVGSLSGTGDLSLDDFPTLRHVLNFLTASGSTSYSPAADEMAATPVTLSSPAAPSSPPEPSPSSIDSPVDERGLSTEGRRSAEEPAQEQSADEMESFLINFVVEQTGYPPEVVELDADLEADLGIDSIKKAQLFGELQEYFDVGSLSGSSDLSLDDFPTLRHVLNFLISSPSPPGGANEATSQPFPAAEPAPALEETNELAPAAAGQTVAELETFLINFVVEQTGYPAEVVELDADLEADLGIDSIKKAQLFGELQEYFDVGTFDTSSELSLDDFPTLRHVLDFLGSAAPAASERSPAVGIARPDGRPDAEACPDGVAGDDVSSGVESCQPLSVRSLEGTPYDMGWQLGQVYGEQIRNNLRRYVEYTDHALDELPGQLASWADLDRVMGSDDLDELQGLADAIEVPLGNVVAHHLAVSSEIGSGASHLAVCAHGNRSGRLIHAFRQPFPNLGALRDSVEAAVFLRKPSRGIAYLAVSYVGSTRILGGVNAAGIGITTYPLSPRTHSANLRASSAARHILQFAPDLDTALELIQSTAGGESWCACLSDARADRLAYVEFDGQSCHISTDQSQIGAALADSSDPNGAASLDLSAASTLERMTEVGQADVEANQVAFAIDQTAGELLVYGAGSGDLGVRRVTISQLLQPPRDLGQHGMTQPTTELTPLPDSCVTQRFVLEMREAPLEDGTSRVPTWSGAAIVLGGNRTARLLEQQLRQAGVEVFCIPPEASLEDATAQVEQICRGQAAPHLFVTTARDETLISPKDHVQWQRQRHETMILPFLICQTWIEHATAEGWIDGATLVAATAGGGDFGFRRGTEAAQGGALSGLLKALFIEYAVMQGRKLRVKALDGAVTLPAEQMVEHIFRELASGNLDYEVGFVDGRRAVPYAVEQSVPTGHAGIRRGSTWVVTGGARGITAACALELGRRYGLKLHLIGSSPQPNIDPSLRDLSGDALQKLKAETMIAARSKGQPAAQAWTDLQKNLEIDRCLLAFEQAGVHATYHACDVANRDSLELTLSRVREIDGPIKGILHGAGIDRSCRFDRKRLDVLQATIGAKVDGAAHLMALTQRDPIRHFIGFGSISGRMGSFGQADYCLASDMLCKLIGAYRRERPWVKAVGFHWHPWDGVGMAARPETKNVLQDQSQLELMPLAEGIAHLLRELEAGAPASEVLITERRHWQRFAEGLSMHQSATPNDAASPSLRVDQATRESANQATQRCVLRMQDAPLAPGTALSCNFDGPVWILGENEVASTLEARLQQARAAVRRIPISDSIDDTLVTVQRMWDEQASSNLFILVGRDEPETELTSPSAITRRQNQGVLLPFFVAQQWYKLLRQREELGQGRLTAAVSLGGDFGFGGNVPVPDGGAICGLLKAVHIEDSRRDVRRVRCKVIDAAGDDSAETVVDAMLRELAADRPEVEVGWVSGQRRVVRPIPRSHSATLHRKQKNPRGGTWVVTGGARGITAIAARELARRFGWNLHLLGASPAPQKNAEWRAFHETEMKAYKRTLARRAVAEGRSPSEAWDRVMKDVEIFDNLQRLAQAGIRATYHQCDVSDRHALERTLAHVRQVDGPIRGILHGAGMIDPGRFESKRRPFVQRLIEAKFQGLLNLVATCQNDPLDYCIAFGSISGRFGGNGLSDYAAGNDVMAKVIDWLRHTHPNCAATCIHWESWEGSGMATLPRFAWGPKAIMNMKYMTPEEGVERLVEELEAGTPDSEVLYTFGDFYPMFYPDEQFPLGEYVPRSTASSSAASSSAVSTDTPNCPLVKSVRRDGECWVGDLPLDPQADAFLSQHRLRDKPLLPVVIGLEALAEVAQGASQRRVVGFHNVRMVDGLTFHRDRPVTAVVRCEASAAGTLECRLMCDFHNRSGGLIQKDRLYLQAEVETADDSPTLSTSLSGSPGPWTPFSYPDSADVYHGPVFRGVNGVSFERASGWGRITALPLRDLVSQDRVQGWLIPSCVLDAAFYVCGIHLWMHGDQAVSLPRQIDRLRLGRAPRDGENCLCHFTCRDIARHAALYDFTVLGQDRSVILQVEGYHKVIIGRGGAK